MPLTARFRAPSKRIREGAEWMTAPNAIGTYIRALFPESTFSFTIGDRLETEAEKEAYLYWIKDRASQLAERYRRDRNNNAEDVYKRTLQLLDRLQESRGCGTGISRSLWSALQTIVKLLACKSDWTNFDSGPIYGGSNATIADRLCLSVDRTKKILQSLRMHGLIAYHRRHANGRRWISRRDDGRPFGHGFSLLPLLVMLEELEAEVNNWRRHKIEVNNAFAEVTGKIAAIRQSLRAVHGEAVTEHTAYRHCAELLAEASTAKKTGHIEGMAAILVKLDETNQSNFKKTTPQRGEKNTPLIKTPIKPVNVRADQKGRNEDGSVELDYGLERAKFDEREITQLFPVCEPYLQLHRNIGRAAQHIAQDSNIPNEIWQRMRQTLGMRAAIVTVLIIAERLAAGEIRSTSAAYANGMLKAARLGDLQLGRTIWGRRELYAA